MSSKKKKKKKVDMDSLNPFAPFQGVAAKWIKDKDERKRYIGTVLEGAYNQFFLLAPDNQEELLKAYSLHFLTKNKSMLKSILPMLKGLIGPD